ncbi:hypothetical protein [Ligilactobacillus equi]|uniref:Uncharacterized protein n=1 Tax=Ligilactobacillus equi DPC 6820 TaxID=1392007 RepID=V7HZ54_9LACO|nr:hypothetical protein [Ligilactobacillus equi]ETA74575.1 hypothetical protein LEQ_0440c [Ligilactobacillus equi DPC 6820]
MEKVNYALNLKNRRSLELVKRFGLHRKKERLTVYNYIHSVTYMPAEFSPVASFSDEDYENGGLTRPRLVLNTSVSGFAKDNQQYNLVDLDGQTTKYDDKLDHFVYELNDREIVQLVSSGLYRGDYQSFLNGLNATLKGKEFAIDNGASYYTGKVNDIPVLAYESQDKEWKDIHLDDSSVINFSLEKELLELSAKRNAELMLASQREEVKKVSMLDELDLGALDEKQESKDAIELDTGNEELETLEDKPVDKSFEELSEEVEKSESEILGSVEETNISEEHSESEKQSETSLSSESEEERKNLDAISSMEQQQPQSLPSFEIDYETGEIKYAEDSQSKNKATSQSESTSFSQSEAESKSLEEESLSLASTTSQATSLSTIDLGSLEHASDAIDTSQILNEEVRTLGIDEFDDDEEDFEL